ncbi:hypothetical protein AWN90_13650 [Nocardia terpenica]|uniref:Phage tail protein n=2 Tax=Nocardia terpenica TaxID=455432 RepID=A0A161X703_9NOCA|nr:hypothetical protein AWN90_13650 [Nocardia terpenica]NQE88130.1 hypothetical protein [Nocardia terpenica]
MQTIVELIGVNGEVFTLAGPNAGDRGVYLDTGLTGIYDPPVRTVYEEPANMPGARYLAHRILRRDIVFGVVILNDDRNGGPNSWMSRDSEWRKAWSYTEDCQLIVTTADDRRTLFLRLGEQPDISTVTDPNERVLHQAVMTCIAGDPFWYGAELVYEFELKTDTTNIPLIKDGNINPAAVTYEFDIPELNPTDQPVWPVWVVSAPGRVVLPDFSFQDDELAGRKIVMPSLLAGEDVTVSVDPRKPQVTSDNNAQVWARMNGVRFRHFIKPYTGRTKLPVTIAQAPAGAKIQLRLMRPWSRPWGLY